MKKIPLPLLSDTLFLFFAGFLFFFCVFRFYLRSFAAALGLGLVVALAGATLFFLLRRARINKKYAGYAEKEEAEKFRFHLAADCPENNVALLAKCLEKKQLSQKNESDESSETLKDMPSSPSMKISGNEIRTQDGVTYVLFGFEKATADDLAPALRSTAKNKTVYANGFTEEAAALARAFDVKLGDGSDVFLLAKECGCLPDMLISPPRKPSGFREKFKFRIRRDAWRGYLFSGSFLLLFSLLTIFPIYYLVSGGILLTISVIIRIFGKKTAD